MAFIPNSDHVLEVLVEGSAYTEQILNRYYFRFSDADTGPTGGSSALFLTNFKTIFRSEVLPVMFDVYSVSRYWVRMITDVAVADVGPPIVYKPIYNTNALDWQNGDSVLDKGSEALAADQSYLPAGTALRLLKVPDAKAIKYFNKAYNRYGPFTTEQLEPLTANHDKWDDTFVTAFSNAIAAFHALPVLDQVAGNGWYHAIWSTQYYGKVSKPALKNTSDATRVVGSVSLAPYVGTQTTRRFNPRVGFRGK